MASHHIALGDDTISMSAAVADKLIARGQGDAALLYLYLLRRRGYLDPVSYTHLDVYKRQPLYLPLFRVTLSMVTPIAKSVNASKHLDPSKMNPAMTAGSPTTSV